MLVRKQKISSVRVLQHQESNKDKDTTMPSSMEEIRDPFFWKAVFAEFFATALFVMNVTTVATLSAGFQTEKIIVISLAIGMSVSILAQIFGPVCGAHLNPAVTVALFAKGAITFARTCFYFIIQLIGAIVGSAITYGLIPEEQHGALGALQPSPGVTQAQAFFVEMLLTVLLCLTVFSSTSTDHGRKDFGFSNAFAIGMSVTVSHLLGVPMTGSGINPARALGPSVITATFHESHWLYWIGPLVGGVFSGLFYRFVLSVEPPSQETKDIKLKTVSAA
ncbi:aquaporin-5-like isoform X1 [Clytia hemisphaerica]|uniref:aquaporin-5-like isoform X1 n=1 Tax=Clytia hemisphaerica TaxID=252671 RepID=UPI0034D4650D